MKGPRFRRPSPAAVLILLLVASLLGAASCSKKPSLTVEPVKTPLPIIRSIEHSAADGARGGEMVEFTLEGDPGFQASASLPGLVNELSLEEVDRAEGIYKGTLAIPPDTKGGTFSLIGRLGTGDRYAVMDGPPLSVIVEQKAKKELTCAQMNQRGMLRPVYFDFDKHDLRPDAVATLNENLGQIRKRSDLSWKLEGHCDERGTNEYNMALGDRRANAVREFLRNAGISSLRLTTISYGEERPADPGHTESAWAKNRRVELVCVD